MQFQIVRLPDYMDVALTGHVALEPLLELIRKLGTLTQAQGDQRLLFDLLDLEGEMHFTGQMQVGEQVARSLSHLARVASVVPASKITRTSEKIARARGARLRVFASKDEAIAWVRGRDEEASGAAGVESRAMDPARTALWLAVQHLFPPHAQAIQLVNGTLAISWPVPEQAPGTLDMATPVTIRLEPELAEQMRLATAEQRKRIATHQEPQVRAGMAGYNPLARVPTARVIVLG
ncbi:MAG: STAS/SEC14 domain-containing protein [Ramlibacter sp.]|nr:STAS/SEC14 domain-containing protein [Ramlibacter sp.]